MGAQCVRPYEPPDEGDTSFGHLYTMTSKHIGRGEFGDVYECFHKYSWVKSAVKFIDKSWMSPKEVAAVHREVALMREMDHPCIVQLVDFFEDRRRFYLVMEMCEGGQLLKRITTRMRRKKPYTEREARDAMHSLLLALACMHNRDIVHRDVKPENLLLVSEDGDAIKLADFGLATKINPRQRLVEWSGTACYMAPEMVNRSPYGKPVDLWSAGVVMFVILCGSHPFFHSCTPVMFNLIRRADFTFSSPVWDHISNDAKDLVRNLLVVDPSKRLTAAQALQHPWIHTEARVLGSRSLDATVHGMIRTIARRRIKAIIYVVFTVHWLRKLAFRRKSGLTKQAIHSKEVALSPQEQVPPSSEGEVSLLSEEKVPLTPPRNVVTYNTQLGVTDTGKTAKHVYVFPGGGCDDAECYCVINGQGDTRRHGAVV